MFVQADKTTNLYTVDKQTYNKLLRDNVTANYVKCKTDVKKKINTQAAKITRDLDIDNRVEIMPCKNAYVTLKDHKPNFYNEPKCRLINPTKSNVGIISKQILQRANERIRKITKLKQWRSTNDVIQWFTSTNTKRNAQFIQLDIVEFYPSISRELFRQALEFAESIVPFTTTEKAALQNARMSILHHDNTTWQKKNGIFDVTMGAYDGAEVSELVGLLILDKIKTQFPEIDFGLYRDDGLGITRKLPGPTASNLTKNIIALFQQYGLKITVTTNLPTVNFLDITLNMVNKIYQPYNKPNNVLSYVNAYSNHPASVLKQIPTTICTRLSTTSSNNTIFDECKTEFEIALAKSSHNHNLKYNPDAGASKTDKVKTARKRKIIWYNPPYNAEITTNLGKLFLKLIDKHFPENHHLHKILNRKTVKLSYSCMPNMKNIIQNHNNKILKLERAAKEQPPNAKTCNCNSQNKPNCPLQGNCLAKCVVYEATINTTGQPAKYIGCTENTFKERFTGHRQTFKDQNKRHSTLLSRYVWENHLNPNPEIKWKIINQSKPYQPGNKYCHLCLSEKYHILEGSSNPIYLNKRSEIPSRCPHWRKYTLARVTPTKTTPNKELAVSRSKTTHNKRNLDTIRKVDLPEQQQPNFAKPLRSPSGRNCNRERPN